MADKKYKSQAEKAASAAKSKKTTHSGSKKSGAKAKETPIKQQNVPVRLITSVVFLGLFILCLVTFLAPEGAIVTTLDKFLHGLLGKAGFIVSVPALLYLFFIHAFSGKRPVKMRSICVGCFILCCGCLAHVHADPQYLATGMPLVRDLYTGGILGDTGGVICGLIAMLIKWLCGTVITYIVLILAAILTLLGAMQITIPSIIRAIQERPRAEWEEEEKEKD